MAEIDLCDWVTRPGNRPITMVRAPMSKFFYASNFEIGSSNSNRSPKSNFQIRIQTSFDNLETCLEIDVLNLNSKLQDICQLLHATAIGFNSVFKYVSQSKFCNLNLKRN